MTDEKPDKKLDLILAKLSDLETRIAALEAQKRPRHNHHSDVWIEYRDAAEMMNRPAAYLRMKTAGGHYKYFQEIERWQPGGFRTRLYVRREHVEAWIERNRTPAAIKPSFTGRGLESALPTLLRLGATRVIRSLGLERHIQGNSKPITGRKTKKGE